MRVRNSHRRRGELVVEAAIAIALIAMLFAVTSRGVVEFRNARARATAQQIADSAAEAQIERLRAGADAHSAPPGELLGPDVTLRTEVSAGAGAWAGMRLATVTATVARRRGRPVSAIVRCYLPAETPP